MPSGPDKLLCCFVCRNVVGFFSFFLMILCLLFLGGGGERGKCGQVGGGMKYL